MAEEYLQAAFEIKTQCDELSRRLLRWHWEKQPGSHTLRALGDYVAERTRQAPEYFSRMPELGAKTTWQQLDTTTCMRILLDPGEGAPQGVHLLECVPRPGAARHVCNGLRTARNAAAHATDKAGAAEASTTFFETVQDIADCYGDRVFTPAELEKYSKAAVEAMKACAGRASAARVQKAVQYELNDYGTGAARQAAAAKRKKDEASSGAGRGNSGSRGAAGRSGASGTADSKRGASGTGRAAAGTSRSGGSASARTGSTGRSENALGGSRAGSARASSGSRASSGRTRAAGASRSATRRKKKPMGGIEKLFLLLGVLVVVAAVYLRAKSLGAV